jgi:hypothetical protein
MGVLPDLGARFARPRRSFVASPARCVKTRGEVLAEELEVSGSPG